MSCSYSYDYINAAIYGYSCFLINSLLEPANNWTCFNTNFSEFIHTCQLREDASFVLLLKLPSTTSLADLRVINQEYGVNLTYLCDWDSIGESVFESNYSLLMSNSILSSSNSNSN